MTDDATLAAILTISALVPFSERGMAIYEIDGVAPQLAGSGWVAASAQAMGRVLLRANASGWRGGVSRGDAESITVGAGSNIQDACVLHADRGKPLFVGERVTVGHQV